MRYEYLATAPFGLEGVVAGELRRMGREDVRAQTGGARFCATPEQAYHTLLWMRAGERVLQRVGVFEATTFDALFEGVKALAWEDFVSSKDAFPVAAKCVRSQLMSVSDCQAIVKKAIVERLKTRHKLNWFEESGPTVGVYLALSNDTAELFLDLAGASLSKRGYRPITGEAPLRETLAASLLMLSPWRTDRPLCDPMCGTGTFCIEAAMLALGVAPGRMREMNCEKWGFMPAARMKLLKEEALAPPQGQAPPLYASDADKQAVETAREHARRAGVERHIEFAVLDAADVRLPHPNGALIANPPYGQRMTQAFEQSFRALRALRDAHAGWTLSVLCAHAGFERVYGRKADKRRRLYNGRLECDFMMYDEKPGARSMPGER